MPSWNEGVIVVGAEVLNIDVGSTLLSTLLTLP
jgi:hypothetical protein